MSVVTVVAISDLALWQPVAWRKDYKISVVNDRCGNESGNVLMCNRNYHAVEEKLKHMFILVS